MFEFVLRTKNKDSGNLKVLMTNQLSDVWISYWIKTRFRFRDLIPYEELSLIYGRYSYKNMPWKLTYDLYELSSWIIE